jgi:zinc D-Ala-D-Ala dipeptidase
LSENAVMQLIGGRLGALLVAAGVITAGCSANPDADAPTPSSAGPRPATSALATTSASATTPAPATTSASAATPAAAAVPPLSARARAAGLVDIRSIVPDAVVDLRYATPNNFTHVRLYPTDARCLVHRTMIRGLRIAAQRLRQLHYVLVFWDCYRPHSVQVKMFRIVPDPNWVARPGPYATSHEAGRSVDVTLARSGTGGTCHTAWVQGHCRPAMGTGFDDFTPRAYAFATKGVSARAEANRAALRRAMKRGGITIYVGEWWHFDGPGSKVARPHLHAPLK